MDPEVSHTAHKGVRSKLRAGGERATSAPTAPVIQHASGVF